MNIEEIKTVISFGNLTIRQLGVLFVVAGSKNLSVRRIAEVLRVPKPSVSRSFDGLEAFKLVKRERSEEDARDVYALLTKRGSELISMVRR
jgi:DNA-binding MarR family transcriptional regulator